jgi:hypothetical protein
MIVEDSEGWHGGAGVDDYFGIRDARKCLHNSGYDCDQLFHYCRLCSMPLDDCGCSRS